MSLFKNKILWATTIVLLLLPLFVFAQNESPPFYENGLNQFINEAPLPTEPLPVLIGKIVRIFLGFLGIIAIIICLYAGFIWMT